MSESSLAASDLVAQRLEPGIAFGQMAAHGTARRVGVPGLDRSKNGAMFALHAGQILLPFRNCHSIEPGPLTRYHRTAKCIEQPGKISIARRRENCPMEAEIFLGTRLAGANCDFERVEQRAHVRKRAVATPFGGETGRFHLNANAQFQHAQHLVDRFKIVGQDGKAPRRRILGNESAKTLAGGDKPSGTQRGKRFAHDGAADTCRSNHLLFGRQPLTRRQIARLDLRDQRVDEPAPEIGRLRYGVEEYCLVIRHRAMQLSV